MRYYFILLALLLVLAGCTGDDAATVPSVEEDLIPATPGGKTDTGYLSDLAAELEGTFSSMVVIDVHDMTPEERTEELERLSAGGWAASTPIDRQVKYAKNRINAAALHMNLSATDALVTSAILTDEGRIELTYETTVETIVTHEELKKEGTTIAAVLDSEYYAIVPDDPTRMADAVGDACLEEGHEGISDYNYFYYYAPDREGCAEAMEAAGVGRINASLVVRNLAPTKTVYPEYDQLTADGKIDVVIFFGAANPDWEPGMWDWGTWARDEVVTSLTFRGFSRASDYDGDGDLYERTNANLEERVTIVGPEVLKLLKDDADGLFQRLVSANEIIFYNGHSFYGSLSVLDDETLYPGHYQIFFMNSCWSYEYYTKQIFKHNVTEEDPRGWALADVVNDTESGYFHNMPHVTRILLTNLLAGAETGGTDGERYYTWDRMIGAMNAFAVSSYEWNDSKSHEIYGVSGVTTNAYDPENIVQP